jgi:NAD+ synthase (glutamine-hydrolysing)
VTTLRLALAQLNLLVGDIKGNTECVAVAAQQAREEHQADLVVFPELSLTGYPPEDLLLRPDLHRQVQASLKKLAAETKNIALIVGHPLQAENKLFNACSLIRDGEIAATYRKQHLPNYGVFDEKRYFQEGREPLVVDIKGLPVGLSICEDIWCAGTTQQAVAAGAAVLININASPFHLGKDEERRAVVRKRLAEAALPVVYVNQIGGQDELIFDGGSFVMDANGEVVMRAPDFAEGLYCVEIKNFNKNIELYGDIVAPLRNEASAYAALVLGVRDYVRKNGFKGAVLGLSGGIDSALCLAIAVDALGADQVEAVLMPSRYTAAMSIEDAQAEANALNVRHHLIPIEPPFQAFQTVLAELLAGGGGLTEQNLQARIRGTLLMAFSNKLGKIVLTTGNKSEIAVGYATLYGDMAGGYAPIKDVSKNWVYKLARWRNAQSPVIPQRVIDRAPSAELAPDQRDEDDLPPYAVLDEVAQRYIELDQTPSEITAAGYDPAIVARIVRMIDKNEYKRRQGAPGPRITKRAFGRDRRYPITSGYSEE